MSDAGANPAGEMAAVDSTDGVRKAPLVQVEPRRALSDAARQEIERLADRYPRRRSALIPALWIVQDELGWLRTDAMEELAEILDIEPVQVEETASFYSLLFKKPAGRLVVDVCTNIACMLLGGYDVSRAVQEKYGIKPGETSADGLVTLREVECIAACMGAPSAQINYQYYENLTPEGLLKTIDELAAAPARAES
ncbi:MAG: NAD(P)H-dependent oxidoreductase subunit E [Chloroflexi bacterium]|nr:NAD(P)H-dependent oxidoreductase subunit E [Chloroflexota bacterium]